MRLSVSHVSTYRYDRPMRSLVQSLRLTPSVFDGQRVLDWTIEVPGGLPGGSFRDGAGDRVQAWTLAGPLTEVAVRVTGTVETQDTAGVLRGHRETVPPMAYLRDTDLTLADGGLAALAAAAGEGEPSLDMAHALAGLVADAIRYSPGTTLAATTAAQALELGHGVCQDHAHALIACARRRGMPARYVSGYLQADADGQAHEAAHAWAELHVQGLGWIGFDPANRCCPDERYIRLGSGMDARDAAPIRGIGRGMGQEALEVSVSVQHAEAAEQAQQQ